MSLIAGRGCRWPPRRDSVSPCAPLSGGRDTHDGHENSPILVFFSNLLAEDPALENWRGVLFGARDKQAMNRRMSVYKAPTIPELREGLGGGPPISPADLAALKRFS